MNEGKIISLLQSEEFLAKLNDATTVDEAKKLFQSEGLSISDEKVKVIMEALESANKKFHAGETITEEDLESVSGGGFVKKALEFVIFSALAYEITKIGTRVYGRGGIKNPKIVKYVGLGKDFAKKIEDNIVDWISPPRA